MAEPLSEADRIEVANAVAAEVTRRLTDAIAAYHRDEAGARVFSLEESAARLHMSTRRLEHECAGRTDRKVEHTQIGRFRGMTNAQIELYASLHRKVSGESADDSSSDIAAAIQMSRQSGARRGRRSAA